MATGRYTYVPIIKGRSRIATSINANKIFHATVSRALSFSTVILKENQRLDHISGAVYGESSMWWVIAAASGVGWGLQIPPGTILRVPLDINAVISLIR